MTMARHVAQPQQANLNFRRSTSMRGERKVVARGRTTTGRCDRRQSLIVRAVDTEVLLGVGAAVLGTAVGLGTLIFYDSATRAAEKRENRQPCFACAGTGTIECRFCNGTGAITVDLGGGQTESSSCINCDGKGSITCTTCNGTGIQPRYLDRREFQDDD